MIQFLLNPTVAFSKFRKTSLFMVSLFLISMASWAQPTVLGTNLVNGSYATYNPTYTGAFYQYRLQATSGAASGARIWEYAGGTAASPNYNPVWRPYAGGQTISFNQFVPGNFNNGARYNTGSGVSGLLNTINANSYYTFNVYKNNNVDNISAIWETTYNPATITSVTQNPLAGAVLTNNSVAVTVTMGNAPASGENVFVRYSTDGYVTSTIVQVNFTGTTGVAVIPCTSSAVSYYVYSANRTKAAIDTDVATNGQAVHDMSSLSVNNNGGANYGYTPTAAGTVFSGSYLIPSACYATIQSFVTAINAGTVGGPVNVYVNAGHAETAAPTGISLTATGTAANPISFIKYGSGTNPTINAGVGTATPGSAAPDGMFKLNGSDYVTIDGFTFTDSNAANPATMEFGVGMFKASLSDGAQYNTIKNCTFNMQRINNAVATSPMVEGAVGITVMNSTGIAATTVLVPTLAAGTNSYNKFYTNTINGGNYGIAITGYAAATPFTAGDMGNDIGGTATATGNTILNFGGGAVTNPAAGIKVQNQFGGFNASYNIVNNNNGSGVNHATTLRGIYAQNGTSASATINNNTVTVTCGATTSQLAGIENGIGTTANANTVDIKNNTVTTFYPTATTGLSYGIYNNGSSAANLNINSNTVTLNSAATSATGHYPIYNTGSTTLIQNINSNTIAVTMSAASTSAVVRGIFNTAAAATCAMSISNNNFIALSYSGATGGSGETDAIYNTATPLTETINNNNFNNLSVKTTGTIYLIYNNNSVAANGSKTIQGNTVVTGFTRGVAGVGNFYGYYDNGGSPSTVTHTISGNNFSNVNHSTNGGTYTGIYSYDYSLTNPTLNVYNNTINNWTTGTGAFSGITVGGFAGTLATPNGVYGNTVTNITNASSSNGVGILVGAQNLYVNVYNNTVSSVTFSSLGQFTGLSIGGTTNLCKAYNNTLTGYTNSSTGAIVGLGISAGVKTDAYQNFVNTYTSGGNVFGIYNFSGTETNIFEHKLIGANNYSVYGLSSSGATSVVEGIRLASTGVLTNVYKNNVYNLSNTSASTTAITSLVNGMSLTSVTAGTTFNVYNNYVSKLTATGVSYLDAVRGISINPATITVATTNNIYNNTIYLDATSTAAVSGSSGIYHLGSATAANNKLDLRNNIIINLSTPKTTGISAVIRRSAQALLPNFATTSNNNFMYAGVPSANNLIMYDNTNSYSVFGPNATAGTYQAAVGTVRDAASFTKEGTYDYAAVTGTTQFFQNVTPGSATYLHILAGITTQVESGAAPVATPAITDDYDGDVRNATTPDIGADEFSGVTPAPSVSFTSIAPATTPQCIKAARLVTVTATTPSGTITGVVLNYSHNGTAQTPIAMTNTSGNIWTGTMLAPTTGNATVTWNVVATNSIALTATYIGTTFADEPATGVTATATATATTICNGVSTTLNGTLTKAGSAVISAALPATTALSYSNPIYSNWANNKSQILFLASELTASGLSAGNLTNLSFPLTSTSVTSRTGFTIKIGNTSATALTTAAFQAPAFTTVYSANYVPFVGANSFLFTTPFAWDGTSNIVLEFCWDNLASTATEASTATAQTTSFVSGISYNRTSTTGTSVCGLSVLPSVTAYTSRPLITFTGNLAPAATAYSWSDGTTVVGTTNGLVVSPTTTTTYTGTISALGCPITTNAVVVTVNPKPTPPITTDSSQCGTAVPTASVADANGYITPTFKWYAASTGGAALQSSTSTTYLATIGTTTTLYVSVTNPTTTCESNRTPVTITIATAPTLTVSANQTVCNGQPYPISVTSLLGDFDNYVWTPAANLFTDAAGSLIYAPGSSATTVYVKSTTAGAVTYTCTANNTTTLCSNTATSVVTVQPVVASIAAPTSTYCLTGTPTLSATPATGYAAGSLQWQSSTTALAGPYTNIAGATSATYTPAAALTQTTYFQLIVKDGSGLACGTAPQYTITINNPTISTTIPATRCGVGTATLGATANAGTTLNWYAAATGGNPIASGTSYTTPVISATTNYYVGGAIPSSPSSATVGTGTLLTTAISQPTAFCNRWTNYMSQTVYTAAELNALGITAGYINSIGYNITTLGDAATNDNMTVRIATTALANASTLTTFANSGFTQVYGPSTYTHTATGLQTITFATPYFWDGVSNIIVEVKQSGANLTNNSITYYTTTAVGMTTYSTTIGFSTTGTLSTQRLNTTFGFTNSCESPRVLVVATVTAPPAFAITNATSAVLPFANCNGAATQYDATFTSGDYDTVKWTATNGNLFTDIAGTTPYVAGTSATTVYLLSTTPGLATVTANATNTVSGCATTATQSVTILPAAITLAASPASICISGTTTLSIAPATASFYTGALVQWQSSATGLAGSFSDIAGATSLTYTTPTLNATQYYQVVVLPGGAGALTPVCLISAVLTVNVDNPQVLTAPAATRCGTGTVALSATASAGSTLNWYAAASGGVVLATGATYSPTVSATTTYYVSASSSTSTVSTTGLGNTSIPSGTLVTAERGIVFTASANGKIVSAQYYSPTLNVTNSVTVRLLDHSTGTVLNTLTLSIVQGASPGWYTMNLNLPVTAGTNYRLLASFTQSVYRISSGANYTLPTFNNLAPLGVITSGYDSGVNAGVYCYFHNITVETNCESPRTAVPVTVTTPPTITPAVSTATICSGTATPLSVSSANDPNYTYTWAPATGLSSTTGSSVSASPLTNTSYTVTANDVVSGCVTTATISVIVNPVPAALVVAPANVTVCANTVQALTASGGLLDNFPILTENFNGLAPGWLQTNSSVGGTVANAAWGFYISNGSVASNDATDFIGTNSDSQGLSGISTATVFYSPSFSLAGFTTANLNFYQYYRSQGLGSDFARVEVSTNGTTWTNLVTYTNTSQGSGLSFLNTNINLTPYVGNTNVQIRFKYDGAYDWYWFIDNVSITGSQATTTTWSPLAGLFTDAAGLSPYTGTPATTVYAKSATTQVYTAKSTVTSSNCFTNSNTATVNVKAITWNGTDWRDSNNAVTTPNGTTSLIINAPYTSAGSISGCNCAVNANVTINTNDILTLKDELTVVSPNTMTFENGASLIQINGTTNTNSGNITYKRNTQPVRRYDYTYWASPVQPQTLFDLSPLTLSDKYFEWNASTYYWNNVAAPSTFMTAAKGFIIRAPQTSDLVIQAIVPSTFVGKPNNGDYDYPVSVTGANDLTFVGNPYPSAMSADKLMSDPANAASIGTGSTIYFWTHNTLPINNIGVQYDYTANDYATYNYTGGVGTLNSLNFGQNNTVPDGNIPAGQAFFIKSISPSVAGAKIYFKNSMRVAPDSKPYNNNSFFRNANYTTASSIEKHRAWLELSNTNGAFKQLLVGYIENATNGYENGYDGVLEEAGNKISFYSTLPGKELVIQGKALPFVDTDLVPLGYRSDVASTFEIKLANTDGVLATQDIFVEDKLLNVIHNIKTSPYSFTTGIGTFNNRFVLRYTNALSNPDFEKYQNSVVVFTTKNDIKIDSQLENIKNYVIYDVLGRTLATKNAVDAKTSTESNISRTNQALIVKITLDNGQVVTKKIVF